MIEGGTTAGRRSLSGHIDYAASWPTTDGPAGDGSAPGTVRLVGAAWFGGEQISGSWSGETGGSGRFESELERDWQGTSRRLDGNYSFDYHSRQRDELVVYRSVTSLLPVFYRDAGGRLEWASDIADLFSGSGPSLDDVDAEVLPSLVSGTPLPPSRTCYRGVRKLLPGHALVVSRRGVRVAPIDCLRAEGDYRDLSLREASEGVRARIGEAVARSLSGHDEVAICLSGGLDSSVVAAETARQRAFTAYHATFPHVAPLVRERARAEDVARMLAAPLVSVDMGASLARDGDALTASYGGLYPALTPLERFFSLMAPMLDRQRSTLILDGDLGDVLLAGRPGRVYGRRDGRGRRGPLALWTDFFDILGCANGRVRSAFELAPRGRGAGGFDRFFDAHSPLAPEAKRGLADQVAAIQAMGPEEELSASFNAYSERYSALVHRLWRPRGIVMAHPLGDRRVLEYCLGLAPWHRNRVYAGQLIDKAAIRAAYLDRLPPSVIRGYAKNVYAALHETYVRQNRSFLTALLATDSILAQLGVLDGDAALDMIRTAHPATAGSVTSAAGTEVWLRGLARSPLPDAGRPLARRGPRGD